jgi:translation initiation factor 2B subunit (eIF-2B alpha/beta/delta family)
MYNCVRVCVCVFFFMPVGSKWRTVADAIERVMALGVRLQAAAPHELSIGNVARHVVHILRKAQLAQLQREMAGGRGAGNGRSYTFSFFFYLFFFFSFPFRNSAI